MDWKNLLMKKIKILIPVYNEADNIEQTLRDLKQNVPVMHEIIVVYDYDGDNTLPVLRDMSSIYDNLHLVKNKIAPGPSGALRTGFDEAK